MTSSSTMKLIPVAPFAMNWYKFGKQRVVTELNVSADLWIIPLEASKRHFLITKQQIKQILSKNSESAYRLNDITQRERCTKIIAENVREVQNTNRRNLSNNEELIKRNYNNC